MSSKLYCHIGMQKAGSKAIQQFCLRNARTLARHGFRYPRKISEGAWHRDVFENHDEAVDQRLALLCQRKKTPVLSYEGAFRAEDRLIAQLSQHSEELHVLMMVREPVSWVNSWMNQIAKAHRTSDDRFMGFRVDDPSLDASLDIEAHLARWERFTATERITAKVYDPACDVVDDFLDWLAIAPADRSALKKVEGDPNGALDAASLRVVLEIKRHTRNLDGKARFEVMRRAHQRLKAEGLGQRGAPRVRLVSDRMADKIVDRFQPAFDRVIERYGDRRLGAAFAQTRRKLLSYPLMDDFAPRTQERALAAAILSGSETEALGPPAVSR